MKAGDVLAKVPGLTRNDLGWWEKQGFIHPERVQKSVLARREYSETDFRLIKAMARYHNQGSSPRAAYEKARDELIAWTLASQNRRQLEILVENETAGLEFKGLTGFPLLVNPEYIEKNRTKY